MKKNLTVPAALALASLALLSACKNEGAKNTPAHSTPATTGTGAAGTAPTGRIAYVDIDSLEANYEYFKNKKSEFTKRQEAIEMELQRSMGQLQQQAGEFQKKASNNGFASQAEVDAAQRRIQQMEQSLNTRRETLAAGLLKDQEAFNLDLKKRLDDFLKDYAKENGYDYVLSYSKTGSILFANESLDVTKPVLEGMNARLKDGEKK